MKKKITVYRTYQVKTDFWRPKRKFVQVGENLVIDSYGCAYDKNGAPIGGRGLDIAFPENNNNTDIRNEEN